jgi:hypothetical protein
MTEENKVQTENTENQSAQGQPAPELTISDLSAVKTIIDVATQRGAFKAAEMEAVGKVYNKLSNFLASVAPKEGQPNA